MQIPNITKLPSLAHDDCTFTDYRDRIFTHLILMDYDWMHYRIQAEIPFDDNEVMLVEFLYIGSTDSYMTVQIRDKSIQYTFSTDIFDTYFEKYLDKEKHAIRDSLAFYGGEIVLEFYNEVIAHHTNVNMNPSDAIILPTQA